MTLREPERVEPASVAAVTTATHSSSPSAPTLSVIVPVYNSRAQLQQCLAALAASDYDDFDVLVVDDGSPEPIAPLAAAHRFKYWRLAERGGPARARNCGARRAAGSIVVFIDADVCVHRDTLSRFAAAFATDATLDAVIGSYDAAPADKHFLSQYKNLFHHYVHQRCAGEISTFWSGCGAMRRDLFLRCGGFDEKRYGRPAIEDIELGTWLSLAGGRIILDRRIQGKHLKHWTLWGLLKTDIFDRGIPWTQLMLRAGGLARTLNLSISQRVSVALSGAMLLGALAAIWWPAAWVVAAAFALALTLLNLDFYRYFAARGGFWFMLRVVPLHWLYFWYCGLSAVAGTVLHHLSGEGSTRPAGWPFEFARQVKEAPSNGVQLGVDAATSISEAGRRPFV